MFFRKNPEIHRAVVEGDVSYVKKHAKQNERNAWGYCAAEWAAFLGREECLRILAPREPAEILVCPKGESALRLLNQEQFYELFQAQFCPGLLFPDEKTLVRTLNSCSRLFSRDELGEEFRALGRIYRIKVREGWRAPVSIRWIDDSIGYGLFAEESFSEGLYLGEYAGLLRQVNRLNPHLNGYCMRYPTVWHLFRYFVVDALSHGSETRFLNHSSTPNTAPRVLVDRRLLHTGFFTTRSVQKGEELTFNYGRDYWSGGRAG